MTYFPSFQHPSSSSAGPSHPTDHNPPLPYYLLAHNQSDYTTCLLKQWLSLFGYAEELGQSHTLSPELMQKILTPEQEPTDTSKRKQPIETRYLDHLTGYQPIRDQYFPIRSVPGEESS
eukprot:sb/3476276/